jgi:hypothetical protein
LSGCAGVGDLTSSGVKLNNQTANALRAKLLRANAGPKGGAAAGRVEVSSAVKYKPLNIVFALCIKLNSSYSTAVHSGIMSMPVAV